jgi:flagellar hook-basal body complex protein FliE
MISGIESGSSAYLSHLQMLKPAEWSGMTGPATGIQGNENGIGLSGIQRTQEPGKVTFGKLIGELVNEVDAKQKGSVDELKRVMTGEVDNLHQSMVAMQEASVAFTLMVEIRNKLMESYQQVMRMQV